MTLAAITALNAVITILGAQAANRYNVIGYQIQKKSAQSIMDKVLVECYIDSASLDWERSTRAAGKKEHNVRIKIQFTAVHPTKADLAVLNDENSTEAQRATALSNLTSPAYETAQALYNAWAAVWEVIYDMRNLTFGLAKGAISDRDYTDFQQDEFPARGGPGLLTATSFLSFRVKEAYLGDSGYTPDATVYDSEIQGADFDGENVDETTLTGVVTTFDQT